MVGSIYLTLHLGKCKTQPVQSCHQVLKMWAILKGWIAPEFYGLQIASQGSPPCPAGPAPPKKTKQGATQIDSLTTGAENKHVQTQTVQVVRTKTLQKSLSQVLKSRYTELREETQITIKKNVATFLCEVSEPDSEPDLH